MTRRACWTVAVTIVATFAAGCSDDAAGPTTTAPAVTRLASTTTTDPRTDRNFPRVCVMAAAEYVSAATGFEAVTSQEGVLRGIRTCLLFDDAGEKVAGVSVGPIERFAEAQAAPDAVPVDGFGDGAVWTENVLYVLMPEESMTFKLYPAAGVAEADIEAVVTAMATDVLSRYDPPRPDDTTP